MADNVAQSLEALSAHDHYPCTFKDCDEVFQSAREWKRHENSNHYQPQCWHCDMCAADEAVFYYREKFVEHLAQVHPDSESADDDIYIEYRRIHANHQGNFYCGFCQNVVLTEAQGIDAWEHRFNHIVKHFVEGCVKENWVDL